MTRTEVLDKAKEIITKDRNEQYGEPQDVFDLIAEYWTAYLDVSFTAEMVAEMMILFKMARLKHSAKADTYIDLVGYSAIAAELAIKEE